MQPLRRLINPQIRVLDAKAGLVEYVASDETLDSYHEVIKADGWRFDEFQKNAPFVDSHDYSTIEKLLGRVEEFRVKGQRLVETVRWAIDVPENLLAQRGFAMTAAGYLKAVSVGFTPVRSVSKWGSDKSAWLAALTAVGLPEESGVRCVYLEQQQKELSACVIGANPNAVAKAYQAGIFRDSDVAAFALPFPELARTLEKIAAPVSRRSYSFQSDPKPTAANPDQTMSRSTFLQNFSQLTSKTKEAFGQVELARRSQSPGDLTLAFHRVALCLADEHRMAGGDPETRLGADPERRAVWGAIARKLFGARLSDADQEALRSRSLDPSTALGTGMLPEAEAQEILNAVYEYGAFRTLGVQPIASDKLRAAKITSVPDAVFITPTANSRVSPADTSLSGAAVTGECNSVSCIIEASIEYIQDARVDLGNAFQSMTSQAIAKRMDFGCYYADGTDDQANGAQTGIFKHASVPSVSAANGNTTCETLQQEDFLRAVAAVAPAALQRPCRFWVNPTFLPSLMALKSANQFLVKSPAETGGEWLLCRFPMTLTAAAPSTNAAGSQVLAFGRGASYLVAMRQELELIASSAPKWNQAIRSIRAVMRARCEMQNYADFAVLKFAAV